MSSLDFDLDMQMNTLEHEWRQGYEASILARAEYQALAANRKAKAAALDAARERLDRAEALKARVMAKIERLEERLLGAD
jgi:repressor of nif and glnA expression